MSIVRLAELAGPLSLGAAAAEYAEAGRVVFPVGGADGKRPLVKWGGAVPGPRHVLQVRAWWRGRPSANIGLRTGAGLVVIDVDPRHGGTIDPSWPETRMSGTPSGGWHLFYRSERRVGSSVGGVAQGVDIRGEGGFVVVPPSPGWRWINEAPLAELPDLGTAVTRDRSADGGLPAEWRPFDVRDEVAEGGRNHYLAQMAGWLASLGQDEDEIERMLQDYNDVACRPPLPPDEVAAIAASIARYHR